MNSEETIRETIRQTIEKKIYVKLQPALDRELEYLYDKFETDDRELLCFRLSQFYMTEIDKRKMFAIITNLLK